jgi:Ca-activated chloride channel family protein
MRRALAIAGVMLVGLAAGRGLAAKAEVGTITGTVTDSATGAALSGAVVEGGGRSATTGADGRYTLSGLPAGRDTITCKRAGYRAQTRAGIPLAAGATVTVDFRLLAAAPPKEEQERKAEARGHASTRRAVGVEADGLLGSIDGHAAGGVAAGYGGLGVTGYGSGSAAAPASAVAATPMAVAPMPAPRTMIRRELQVAAGDVAPPEEPEREGYDAIRENAFLAVRDQPLSTFSIDVDTASYANVRRFVDESRLPPKDAVRIEELINYFPYRYPDPKGDVPFSVNTEVSVAPWNPAHRLLRIGLQGRRMDTASLPPNNLVFLIDVSGSMNEPDKLPLLKAAFKLLALNLRPQDRVSIVVYAGAAGVVLPTTPGSEKGAILAALDRLEAGGSTAGGAGIRLAYDIARQSFLKGGNNRVILATDGDFNVGASSDGEMVELIEQERKSGVFLTVLGFGRGNYQDAKMQKLADAGNGNHAYVDGLLEAKKVLVSEMGATLFTIAKDVKLQLEFNPTRVKAYRLIGYENRLLRNRDFNDDTKDAGELGAGHSVTALYEIVPADSKEEVSGVDPLKYQTAAVSAAADSDELLTVKLRYKAPNGDQSKLISEPVRDEHRALADTSPDFRFAASVAEFGLLLRDSEHKGKASWDDVAELARTAVRQQADAEGYREDFVKLVEKARLLSATTAR